MSVRDSLCQGPKPLYFMIFSYMWMKLKWWITISEIKKNNFKPEVTLKLSLHPLKSSRKRQNNSLWKLLLHSQGKQIVGSWGTWYVTRSDSNGVMYNKKNQEKNILCQLWDKRKWKSTHCRMCYLYKNL